MSGHILKSRLVQQTDYYPYGMPHSDGTGAELNRRKFGAKELMTEFGIDMYNFEARYLGLPIPAFQSPDPLAYKTPHVSPYSYCHGDPVNFSDPTGQYRTRKEAMEAMGEHYPDADVYLDNKSGQWYIALNEEGTSAYESGGILTKHFGPENTLNLFETKETLDNSSKVISMFSSSKGANQELIHWAAKDALKSVSGYNPQKYTDVQRVEKAFGETVGKYYRVFKSIGYLTAGATTLLSADAALEYYYNGGNNNWVYVKYAADVVFAWAGCLGPWGFAASTLYFILDNATDGFGTNTKPKLVPIEIR